LDSRCAVEDVTSKLSIFDSPFSIFRRVVKRLFFCLNMENGESNLDAESNRLAHGLRALGIEPGDRLGIFMPNCQADCGVTGAPDAEAGEVPIYS
jgi:hypothetical protein